MQLKNQNYTLHWVDNPNIQINRTSELADFRQSFEALYHQAPIKAVLLFLEYLAANGLDAVSAIMGHWVLGGTLYLSILLDLDFVAIDTACLALPKLRAADPQFSAKFIQLISGLTKPEVILRALRLTPALEDYSFLICWLRMLEQHPDTKIRSGSAKLLCRLRPTKGMVERQLQSKDPRVRAGALEALWQSGGLHSDVDALTLLRKGMEDPHHRVVANALVGLHYLGDITAVQKMIELSQSKQHLFRAAMAWALGMVHDARSVTTLEQLGHDRSFTVRKHAENALRGLQSLRCRSEFE